MLLSLIKIITSPYAKIGRITTRSVPIEMQNEKKIHYSVFKLTSDPSHRYSFKSKTKIALSY